MINLLVAALLLATADKPGPHAAYEAQKYDEALQGFIEMQVEKPKDAAVMLNVGSAHYQLQQYEAAEKAFTAAAQAEDKTLREHAYYNLGNTAFKQGRLDEALINYEHALQIDPQDQDARLNIEYVRQQMQKRQDQAQRTEEDQQKRAAQEQEQQKQQEQQKKQDPKKPPEAKQPNKPGSEPHKSGAAAPDPAQNKQASPTPSPSKAPDSAALPSADQEGGKQQQAPDAKGQHQNGKAQAQRYLDSISEDRPKRPPSEDAQKRGRSGKDW